MRGDADAPSAQASTASVDQMEDERQEPMLRVQDVKTRTTLDFAETGLHRLELHARMRVVLGAALA